MIIILFFSIYFFIQCSSSLKIEQNENISCKTAYEIIQKHKADSSFVIIDLRPKKMFDESHIEGAIYFNVFSTEVDAWLSKLDKNKIFLIYCNSGVRSAIALKKMTTMGFKNIYHMYEGIKKWKKEGFDTKKS